jgi:hypothetical protein
MSRIGLLAAAAVLLALGGCATLTEDSTDQIVEVHTVQNHREIAGIGCVLTNELGRWYVTAPGRVTVTRYARPLTVDCARDGIGRKIEYIPSRYDAHDLIGTVLATGGIGYVMDSYSGAGFAYPAVLTIDIPKVIVQQQPTETAGNPIF